MTARSLLAIWTAKLMKTGLKIMGRKGTHLPGAMALKVCPNLLQEIAKPKTIIGVTGTNGKTTVANMIGDVFAANGISYADNRFGSNIDTGISSALLQNVTWTGKCREELAVLEIDERMTPRILPYVKLDYLVVTNLFRDSYKRNAHAEFIADILERNISDDTMLILNGDDLISGELKPHNARRYFGLSAAELPRADRENIIQDVRFCPNCESPVEYTYRYYHHIGKASCPNCEFGNHDVDFDVTGVDYEGCNITVQHNGAAEVYRLMGNNMTDVYNQTAVISFLRTFGLTKEQVESGLQNTKIVESRYDSFVVGKHRVVMNLAKGQNPIACSRVFDFIRREPGKKAVMMMIDDHDDNKYSSENIAWLFDADFEYLLDDSVVQVLVGGDRHLDFEMRLRFAGMERDRFATAEKPTDLCALLNIEQCDTVFILYDLYTYADAEAVREQLKVLLAGGTK